MLNYIYDGSLEGLLTAIYESYYRREVPDRILSENNLQFSFCDKNVSIVTNLEKSEKVYQSIRNKISEQALQNVFLVFFSELEEAGTLVYRYLQYGWKIGENVDKHLSEDRVLAVQNICRKVNFEVHRMLGLIRFMELKENLYYAPMEPDFNIAALVAPHFARRLADQNWMIHDLKRGLAAAYNRMEWVIMEVPSFLRVKISEGELDYQKLWKEYFKSISIPDRKNPRLQRQHMPSRYWTHLVEMQ